MYEEFTDHTEDTTANVTPDIDLFVPQPDRTPKRRMEAGRTGRKVSNILIVGSIAAGAIYVGEQIGEQVAEAFTTCQTTSASDIHRAEQLLNAPLNPDIPRRTSQQLNTYGGTASQRLDRAHTLVRQDMAKRYGVTVFDDAPYVNKLVHRGDRHLLRPLPFNTYLHTAQQFLGKYGIQLQTTIPDSLKGHEGAQQATASQLEEPAAKANVISIMDGVTTMPKEYVAMAGLRHIYLASIPDEKARLPLRGDVTVDAFARVNDQHDTIVYNADTPSPLTPDTIRHETMHLADISECGNSYAIQKDPQYSAINAGVPYGQANPSTLESQQLLLDAKEFDLRRALDLGRSKKACVLEQDIATVGQTIKQNTQYGNTNLIEDKAEVGATLFTPEQHSRMLDPRLPALRQKFTLLVARILKRQPAVAQWVASIGQHWPAASANPAQPDERCHVSP